MTEQEELKEMLGRITCLTYDSHRFSPHTCTICKAVMGIGKHNSNCVVGKAERMINGKKTS